MDSVIDTNTTLLSTSPQWGDTHFLFLLLAHIILTYTILMRPYNRANMDGIDPVTPPSSPQIEPEPEVEGVIVDDIPHDPLRTIRDCLKKQLSRYFG